MRYGPHCRPAPAIITAGLFEKGAAQSPGSHAAPGERLIMPILTPSDLSELARYPVSLRSAARALWGSGLSAPRAVVAPSGARPKSGRG